MMDYGHGMVGMWVWMLLGALFLAGLLVLGFLALRATGGRTDNSTARPGRVSGNEPPRRRSRAREILDERYARGDITIDEYHERLPPLRDED
jgi:putative membrane protein